jgi:trigger factor
LVGSPDVREVHFHDGEDLHFKVEFEVAPEIELGEYKGIEIHYEDPEVSDEEIDQRVEVIREQKADFVTEDPRPAAEGDHAVVALKSISAGDDPIKQDEMVIHLGDTETLPAFTENILGMAPGDTKQFDVTYPEDFGQEKLAGKTISFHAHLKAIRRKELPELNDEFARDIGDFQSVEELREAVRRALFAEKQQRARSAAIDELIKKLVEAHDFPLPEAYIERQIESQVENYLRTLAAQGVDPRQVKLDWGKVKTSQRGRAIHEVKASLLVEKVSERENIAATRDEVDQEVNRIAKQERQPVAAVRMRLEKEKLLGRIAGRIQTEKTLQFLFENARKVAGVPPEPANGEADASDSLENE